MVIVRRNHREQDDPGGATVGSRLDLVLSVNEGYEDAAEAYDFRCLRTSELA